MSGKSHLVIGALLVGFLLASPRSGLAGQAGRQPAPTQSSKPAGNISSAKPDEDWTTPFLGTSHLTPARPIVVDMDKDDKAPFTREMVSLQWRPFDSIYVYIIKPKGISKPPPVLFLYGYPTSTNRFLDASYCERITAGGCAAIGFDTALTGERFRMRPMKQWFVSELPESLATSSHDVQLILNYLATRSDLDMSRIGIFGQGSGGTIAVLAAAADPRIKAVDLLTPWGDWPKWVDTTTKIPQKDRPGYTQSDFLKSAAPLEPVDWLPKLKDKKVRLQFVDSDLSVPLDCQKAMEKAAPIGSTQAIYKNNVALYAASSGGRLFDWLGQQLHGASKDEPVTTADSHK